MIDQIVQSLVYGLFQGSLYVIIGLGFNMLWGVMGVINVAYGHFMLLSTYISFTLFAAFQFDPLLAILVSVPTLAAISLVLFKTLVSRVMKTAATVENVESKSVLLFWGIAYLFEGFFVAAWKVDMRTVNPPYSGLSYSVGGIIFPFTWTVSFVISVVAVVLLHFFLKKTYIGIAARAAVKDKQAVKLMGVNILTVSAIIFVIGSTLAAVAGSLTSVNYLFYPAFAWRFLGTTFIVVVLGGLGNPVGTIIGGLLLGEIGAMVTFAFSSTWYDLIAAVLLLLILNFKPKGIFGK